MTALCLRRAGTLDKTKDFAGCWFGVIDPWTTAANFAGSHGCPTTDQ